MFMDSLLEFADADTLTTTTGTNNEGDVVDLGLAGRDVGNGQPLYLVVQVTTAVTSAGAATVAFQVVSDDSGTIATNGTQTVHVSTGAIGKASLTAGQTFVVPLPAEFPVYERYLGFQAVVGTAALTAGAVNAFITLDPTGWKAYPDASN